MYVDFKKIFQKESDNIKVKANRGLILKMADTGKSRHVSKGEIVTLSPDEMRSLEQGDVTRIEPKDPKAKPVIDPTPKRGEIAPLPNRWDELPACFKTWWEITEQFRVAVEHKAAIRECRMEVFGTYNSLFGGKDTKNVLVNRLDDWKDKENLTYHARTVDTEDPTNIRLEYFIRNAEDKAEDYLKQLRNDKGLDYQRAYYESGLEQVRVSQNVQVIVDKIASIGFEIFEARLAPLGLHSNKARLLYTGSADFNRYGQINQPYRGDTRSAGLDADTGEMIIYNEDSPKLSACHLLREIDRAEELAALLAEAEAELAKVHKLAA